MTIELRKGTRPITLFDFGYWVDCVSMTGARAYDN